MIRGAVYEIDLGKPRGHEQGGRRYGMVVSPSNMPWTVATVIPTSTSAGPASFRPEIEINGKRTRLLIDQLRTIDTAYIRDLAAIPSREEIAAAELALARYLGIAAAGGWLEPQEQGEIG